MERLLPSEFLVCGEADRVATMRMTAPKRTTKTNARIPAVLARHAILLVQWLCWMGWCATVAANSSGTGSCAAGINSVGGTHLDYGPNSVSMRQGATGTLTEAAVDVDINGVTMTPGSAAAFDSDVDLAWTVTSQVPYKGIFVRVQAGSDNAFTHTGVGSGLSNVALCDALTDNVIGVNHNSAVLKTTNSGVMNFSGSGSVSMDVTIVFDNIQTSVYATSNFPLLISGPAPIEPIPTAPPAPVPTFRPSGNVPVSTLPPFFLFPTAPTGSPVTPMPTALPTSAAVITSVPSSIPTKTPSFLPTVSPTGAPTAIPTDAATTIFPTTAPVRIAPTSIAPTSGPTVTRSTAAAQQAAPAPSNSPPNNALLIGAVVGALIGGMLIMAAIVYIQRRNRNGTASTAAPKPSATVPDNDSPAPTDDDPSATAAPLPTEPPVGYKDQCRSIAKLPATTTTPEVEEPPRPSVVVPVSELLGADRVGGSNTSIPFAVAVAVASSLENR